MNAAPNASANSSAEKPQEIVGDGSASEEEKKRIIEELYNKQSLSPYDTSQLIKNDHDDKMINMLSSIMEPVIASIKQLQGKGKQQPQSDSITGRVAKIINQDNSS